MPKYTPYVDVFALGVGATGMTYELQGGETSPDYRAVSKVQTKLHARPRSNLRPPPRLVERSLLLPVAAPNPRLEVLTGRISKRLAQPTRSSELRAAATVGDLARVRELLAEKVSTDAPDSRSDVVRVLIAAGADVDNFNSAGNARLMPAAPIGNPVIVHMLLEADATVDAKNKDGATVRLLAKRKGHDVVYVTIVNESQRRANLKVDSKVTPRLVAALQRGRSAARTKGRTVRVPPLKVRSSLDKNGRPQSAKNAPDGKDDAGWLSLAVSSVGTLIESVQTSTADHRNLCEGASNRRVQNSNGGWIECRN